MQLFTATVADIKVREKIKYTQRILVSVNNPNAPRKGDFIGIYPDPGKDVPMTSPLDTPLFWLYTCKSQTCTDDYKPKKWNLINFNVKDPVSEDLQQWPLPSGNYRVCLGNRGYEEVGDTLIECIPFKVKSIPIQAINNLKLKNRKKVYGHGDSITATFSAPMPIVNSWVGIYKYIDNPPIMSLPEPMLWVYLGCNNQGGDQKESNDCSKKKKYGSITINETSQDPLQESWPIDVGTYQLCIVLDNNTPYNNFKCFSQFEVESLSI